jgi:hypothetical protein
LLTPLISQRQRDRFLFACNFWCSGRVAVAPWLGVIRGWAGAGAAGTMGLGEHDGLSFLPFRWPVTEVHDSVLIGPSEHLVSERIPANDTKQNCRRASEKNHDPVFYVLFHVAFLAMSDFSYITDSQ